MPFYVMALRFMAGALLAKGSSVDVCLACVETGGSFQGQRCQPRELGRCPIADIGCCTSEQCCVTTGCRSPDQHQQKTTWEPGYDCKRCCTDDDAGCLYSEWTGGPDSTVAPWYNANGLASGKCSAAFPGCTPCARCSLRTEQNLQTLEAPVGCVCKTGGVKTVDACFNPGSCDCYCNRLEQGLASCPHLREVAHTRIVFP